MKIKNAIILAGGKGTRLKSVIKNIPKPMAPIRKPWKMDGRDTPFLAIILDHLYNYGFEKVVLSVSYEWEMIKDYFQDEYRGMKIQYAIEGVALGTGGGIQLASDQFENEPFFVFNGDTLFRADLWEMEKIYFKNNPDLVMALKPMKNFSRYGTVEIIRENKIAAFNEKKYCEEGLINGGVYLMNASLFKKYQFGISFSFEKDLLEKYVNQLNFKAIISDEYFIDIGIPEDYNKAIKDFNFGSLTDLFQKIRLENWTLFLDRDGVINQRIPGNYVKYPKEFSFIKGSDIACSIFAKLFKIIVVVTNQQGVGKNLMRAQWLDEVHEFMNEGIQKVGGRIDKVYYCPELAKNNPKCRKPNTGMAYQAKADFPDIDFNKSIIVGDSISDIQFGNRLGMFTVFVETKTAEEVELAKKENIDLQFKDLISFANALEKL